MKSLSIVAVVVAVLSFGSAAAAQLALNANAGAQANPVEGAYASSSGEVSPSVNTSVSASISASASQPDVSSGLSSVSSELSSAPSSASSSSSSTNRPGVSSITCETLNTSAIMTTAIDAAALSAVISVQVTAIDDCGLGDLARINVSAAAAIAAIPAVEAALRATGETHSEIVGYSLDGAKLVVFVRNA